MTDVQVLSEPVRNVPLLEEWDRTSATVLLKSFRIDTEESLNIGQYENAWPLTTALPRELQIGSLRDGRLRLCEPLLVSVEVQEDQVVVSVQDIGEYGHGADLSEALVDLQQALAGLFFTLEADQECLGADLHRVWESLRSKIRRIR